MHSSNSSMACAMSSDRMILSHEKSECECSKDLEVAVDNMNLRGAKINLGDRYPNLKWNSHEFGLPNYILRSSFFRALQRNHRVSFIRRDISSLDRLNFSVGGPTLNQSEFGERKFLQFIDRGGQYGKVGKSDREWLLEAISRLCSTKVTFASGANLYEGGIVQEYMRDGLKGCYRVSLNPRFFDTYGVDCWTKLNIDIRNSLRGNPLAQFLYGFFHSNARTYPLKIRTIHNLSGSEAGRNSVTESARNKVLAGWRDDTLRPALAILKSKLEEHGLDFEWKIDQANLVTVKHQPSKSQQRHLSLKGEP